MDTMHLRFDTDTEKCLEASFDGVSFQPVYICSLHKITSYIPLINRWADKDLQERLSCWKILPPVTDPDPNLPDKPSSVNRKDEWGLQATYRGYQLYIYSSDKDDSTLPNFWEPAHKDRLQSEPADRSPLPKDDDGTIILPVSARGP